MNICYYSLPLPLPLHLDLPSLLSLSPTSPSSPPSLSPLSPACSPKQFSTMFDIPYLEWRAVIGVFLAVLLIIFAISEITFLVTKFSRFSEEIFTGIVAIFFTYEATKSIIGVWCNVSVMCMCLCFVCIRVCVCVCVCFVCIHVRVCV